MSYGQVAAYIGAPQAARQVGWAMHSLGPHIPDFPWWRVLNNKGKITIKGSVLEAAKLQKQLLQAEGVQVNDDFSLAMGQYRYQLKAGEVARLRNF